MAAVTSARPRSGARLEAAAREAANRILDLHHRERTPPVPLLQMLGDAGYRVVRKKDPVSITAFCIRDALGDHTIGLNARANARAQRFALAHAMGHGELHDEDLLICVEVRTHQLEKDAKGLRSHPTPAMEREAHLFSIELLMPAQAVHKMVDGLFGAAEHPLRADLVKRVAAEFEVPEVAAGFRLVDLAILSP